LVVEREGLSKVVSSKQEVKQNAIHVGIMMLHEVAEVVKRGLPTLLNVSVDGYFLLFHYEVVILVLVDCTEIEEGAAASEFDLLLVNMLACFK